MSPDCLHPSVILCHSFKTKLLLNPGQIVWVWISKTLWTTSHAGLVVNVIPGDDVVEACGDRSSDGEGESPVEGFPQQLQDFLSLLCGWQEGSTRGAAVSHPRVWVFRPLYPCRETVLYDDRSAVLKARQALPAAHHRHRALRLGPRVLSVIGVAYRTGRLKLENSVDTHRAKRVRALQRFLLLNFVQANGAVFRTFVWCVCHYFPVSDDKCVLPFRVWVGMCPEIHDVKIRKEPILLLSDAAHPCVRKWCKH